MSNPRGIRTDDRLKVASDHPDGRFAPGERYVRVVTITGDRVFLGLGWAGGKNTDPAVTWIPATNSAITEHIRHF
jgi:hypothetical protein